MRHVGGDGSLPLAPVLTGARPILPLAANPLLKCGGLVNAATGMWLIVPGIDRLNTRRNMWASRWNIREILWYDKTEPDRLAYAAPNLDWVIKENMIGMTPQDLGLIPESPKALHEPRRSDAVRYGRWPDRDDLKAHAIVHLNLFIAFALETNLVVAVDF